MYRKSNGRKVARNVPKSERPLPRFACFSRDPITIEPISIRAHFENPGDRAFLTFVGSDGRCILNVPCSKFREISRTRESSTFRQSCDNEPHRARTFFERNCRATQRQRLRSISLNFESMISPNCGRLSISRGQGRICVRRVAGSSRCFLAREARKRVDERASDRTLNYFSRGIARSVSALGSRDPPSVHHGITWTRLRVYLIKGIRNANVTARLGCRITSSLFRARTFKGSRVSIPRDFLLIQISQRDRGTWPRDSRGNGK